ncbi:PD-(D/E)XK nuclease family protein [Trichococcus shcherbakoviae]|uniref:PD-(D/E)XK nuclease superfamily n=1 Tax=Trichococcus shcherbakoviae TaxID=2094020 RepID=A0A383TDY7_9LACT|nr:PD-(D/E)XK nuclease family protein [Trichococcus shcherbakoviae]SYZ78158.1 Hypothetical protein TART1_0936 [Trichococcus shcherbakoviae]
MISNYEKVLDDFKSLHIQTVVIEPTFLDISGFPHYENVCSNILQFFFQTNEAHGMGDLFIQAILKILGENISNTIIVNDVFREQPTPSGKRLDIVITTDDYVVGIENKIYAVLTNDLADYSSYLQSILTGRKLKRIVLSLYPIATYSGFVNITYKELFKSVDSLMGNYWQGSNRKFMDYLNDFMQNIRRLEGAPSMNSDEIKFINDNITDLENLFSKLNLLKKELRQRVQDLGKQMVYDEQKCKQWFWREEGKLFDDLVHDILIDGATIAIDTHAYPKGWGIYIWLRESNLQLKNKDDLKDWLIKQGVPNGDVHISQTRNLYEKKFDEVEEVAKNLQSLLITLCK